MDRKTREAIELDVVLDVIAGEAASSLGAGYVRALEPSASDSEIAERLGRVRELIGLFERNLTLTLGGLEDITSVLDHAKLEGSALEPEEWPRLRRSLELIEELHHFAANNEEGCSRICALCSQLAANPELLRSINKVFDQDGLIRDDASPELSRIRSGMRRAEQSMKTTVNRLLGRLRGGTVLQEEFATIRNGRTVFPVRAGARGRIGGIVHGSSATGETLYIEPTEVVEAANDLEMLRTREAVEIARIMAHLTSLLRPWLPEARANLEVFRQLDGAFALSRNAYNRGWKIPDSGAGGALRLFDTHHPLLHMRRQEESVPITLTLDRADRTIVISGPNAGGKTTLMKTVALTTVMLQSGSPVPTSPDSRLPYFAGFYADIGDQQDLAEGVSTFSGHMRRLREILDAADDHSLILLDELGTGTDPEEGGALAQVLLEEFASRQALTFATSHLGPVKKWAEDTQGARNASFSLDATTHRPTFRLRLDLPGPSEAFYIAQNEGLPEWLLDRARELVGEQKLAMGELLRRIEEREQALGKSLREARARAESLETQEKLAARRADELREERKRVRQAALEDRETAVRDVRERIEKLIADLPSEEQLRQRKEVLNEARRESIQAQRLIATEREDLSAQEKTGVRAGQLRVGSKVYVRAMNSWGEVVRLDPEKEKASVLVGQMTVEVSIDGLSRKQPERMARQPEEEVSHEETDTSPKKKKKKSRRVKAALRELSSPDAGTASRSPRPSGGGTLRFQRRDVPMELDLHGYRVEEAMAALDKYLDSALLADYPHVRIVHGTGEGKLYRAVHNFLRDFPAAKKFRFGNPDEGGGGVTIVEFE